MRVITSEEMARIEKLAYAAGEQELDFMQAAGAGIADCLLHWISPEHRVSFLCGKGNNSGDGYVAALQLHRKGIATVVYQLTAIENSTALCQQQHGRFLEAGGTVRELTTASEKLFHDSDLIVDALFGTGFHGSASGIFAEMIDRANQSGVPIVAVDIPSGLNGTTGKVEGVAIQASMTLYLGLPKIGFFVESGWSHVGALWGIDFGLKTEFVEQAIPICELLDESSVGQLLPPIRRDRHKYEAGVVFGFAGSPLMPGAAALASKAALRAGAGLVRILDQNPSNPHLSPEIVRVAASEKLYEEELFQQASALFVGPGWGRDESARQLFEHLLPQIRVPVVFDADALFFLSEKGTVPCKAAVLTPHLGELRRLLGLSERLSVNAELLVKCQQYVEEHQVTLVLKGAPSWIFHPGSVPKASPKGDPGMATAGSGDVLTGVIAALLAQGADPLDAAIVGVYIHGMAGEFAAEEKSSYGMIASDLVEYLPAAFQELSIEERSSQMGSL